MKVYDFTLLEFMCGLSAGVGCQPFNPWEALQYTLNEPRWVKGTERAIEGKEGFATAIANRAGNSTDDVVLLAQQNGNWIAVGGYIDTVVAICDEFCHKGLSTALILRALESRSLPKRRDVTISGYKALQKAWHAGVSDGIVAGVKIRPEVLADYNAQLKIQ